MQFMCSVVSLVILAFLLLLLFPQMQKQDMLTMTSKESRSMWEEEVKSRALLENRLAQLEREKAELLEQVSPENRQSLIPGKYSK